MEQVQDRGNSVDKLEKVRIVLGVTCTDNNYIVRRGQIKKSITDKPRNRELLEVLVVSKIKFFYITKTLVLQI